MLPSPPTSPSITLPSFLPKPQEVFEQLATDGKVKTSDLELLLNKCKIRLQGVLSINQMQNSVDPQKNGLFDFASLEKALTKLNNEKEKRFKTWSDNAGYVDICFLLDATKSMDKWIVLAKDAINNVMELVSQSNKKITKFRYAMVAYRDFDCTTTRFEIEPFSLDKSNVINCLNNIVCAGGGDYCEDVDGGIEEVLKLEWASFTRVLIHITDAPGHGTHYHIFTNPQNDNYMTTPSTGSKSLVQSIVGKKIDYFFLEIEKTAKHTKKMVEQMRLWMKEANDTSNPQSYEISVEQISDDISSLTLIDKVKNMVVESHSRSTIRVESKNEAFQKICELSDPQLNDSPEWVKLKNNFDKGSRKGKVIRFAATYYKHSSEEFAKQFVDYQRGYCCFSSDINIIIDDVPLGEGSERIAYRAYEDRRVKLVAKKINYASVNKNGPVVSNLDDEIKMCTNIALNHLAGKYLANEFSALPEVKFGVKFVEINLLVFENAEKEIEEVYTLEAFIEGDYIKYFSNSGSNCYYEHEFSDPELKSQMDNTFKTAHAFSHWTYEATKQKMLITDIQGVKFRFTDPAVLTKHGEAGLVDTGSVGIQKFFENHSCNGLCQQLGLTHPLNKECDYDPLEATFSKEIDFIKFCGGYCCSNYIPYKIGQTVDEKEYVLFCEDCHQKTRIKESKKCKIKGCPLRFKVDEWYWWSVGKVSPTKCPLHRGGYERTNSWVSEKRAPVDAEFTWDELEEYLKDNPGERKFLNATEKQKTDKFNYSGFTWYNCPPGIPIPKLKKFLGCTTIGMKPISTTSYQITCNTAEDAQKIMQSNGLIFERRLVTIDSAKSDHVRKGGSSQKENQKTSGPRQNNQTNRAPSSPSGDQSNPQSQNQQKNPQNNRGKSNNRQPSGDPSNPQPQNQYRKPKNNNNSDQQPQNKPGSKTSKQKKNQEPTTITPQQPTLPPTVNHQQQHGSIPQQQQPYNNFQQQNTGVTIPPQQMHTQHTTQIQPQYPYNNFNQHNFQPTHNQSISHQPFPQHSQFQPHNNFQQNTGQPQQMEYRNFQQQNTGQPQQMERVVPHMMSTQQHNNIGTISPQHMNQPTTNQSISHQPFPQHSQFQPHNNFQQNTGQPQQMEYNNYQQQNTGVTIPPQQMHTQIQSQNPYNNFQSTVRTFSPQQGVPHMMSTQQHNNIRTISPQHMNQPTTDQNISHQPFPQHSQFQPHNNFQQNTGQPQQMEYNNYQQQNTGITIPPQQIHTQHTAQIQPQYPYNNLQSTDSRTISPQQGMPHMMSTQQMQQSNFPPVVSIKQQNNISMTELNTKSYVRK